MSEKEPFITVAGFDHYYGIKPFDIDRVVILKKEPESEYDSNAIAVIVPIIGKVGYVANSPHTIAGGCLSASDIYSIFPDECIAFVRFTTGSKVIARLYPGKKLLVNIELTIKENDQESKVAPFVNATNDGNPKQ